MKQNMLYLLLLCNIISCSGQKPFGTELLRQEKIIQMPGVKGRIDHMAINLSESIVYVAALGNNSIEVVDIKKGLVVHSIKGLDEPQGVAYISATNELVVANGGNGNCVFYNAITYEVIATIDLGGDADNIRYSSADGKMYVGYGSGGIAVIDAMAHKLITEVKLPAHPESLQIDQKNNVLFVNLPDDNSIAVIDLKNFTVKHTWKTNDLSANFPMILDTSNNSVIIGYRHPAVLVSYHGLTGKELSRTALISDVDDVYYNHSKQMIFASGGGGAINIFKKDSADGLKKIADIPTRTGARTSLLIPVSQTFILAERATAGKPAALAVYKVQD